MIRSTTFISRSLPSFIAILTVACGLNSNPPEYVKGVVAYKEGSDALAIYFVLADKTGAMTTADGEVTFTIMEDTYSTGKTTLFTRTHEVSRSDFREAEVGRGAFAHKVILCSLGRIPYSRFTIQPSARLALGRIFVVFTPKGGWGIQERRA